MDISIVNNGRVESYLRDGLRRDAQLPVLPPEVTRIEVTWVAQDDVVRCACAKLELLTEQGI